MGIERRYEDALAALRNEVIGFVFQGFNLLPRANLVDNVALPLGIRNEKEASVARRVDEMLEKVGLIYKKASYIEQLSGGEQQRVAIARALIHQPGVLIADEPTGNLDEQMAEEIMDLLDGVNAQGTTVFVATHDLDLVKRRARRVVNIRAGRLEEEQLTPPKSVRLADHL